MLQFLSIVYSYIAEVVVLLSRYIANNSFPQPLSEEDEEKYFLSFKRGDKEARDILITHNLRLVAHIVKKYENNTYDREDLISIGTIGLIKAINSFDISKGYKLVTYASRCIENEILMHFRSTKKLKSEISIENPIGTDKDGKEITILDTLGTVEDMITEGIEMREEFKQAVSRINEDLTEVERKVVIWRLGLVNDVQKSQKEIAKILGISRSYVSRIETKAYKKIAKHFQ